jgi:CRP-like cAMP-binding protein
MSELDLRRAHPSFEDLPESSLGALASSAEARHYESGTVIFEADTAADEFFIIRTGLVALQMTSLGREPLVVETLGPGELVGVSWAFPPYRWNWRAIAQGDVEVVAFDAAEVRDAAQTDQVLRTALLEAVAIEAIDRLHATRIRLMDIYGAGSR